MPPAFDDGAQRLTSGLSEARNDTGRVAYVEVTIPDSYDPPSDALVDLGPAIRSADPDLTSVG